MARTKTKATATTITVDNVEQLDEKAVEKKSVPVEKPLLDTDEIEVVSLIPNISYKDSKTNDMYEWNETGHVEYMTFDSIKNMWRNHKAYFRNLWLKPNDERVIKYLGLKSVLDKYEFLMDESNYMRASMGEISKILSEKSTPNGLKIAVSRRIKDSVIKGEISDVVVIKALEKQLNLDLISFL